MFFWTNNTNKQAIVLNKNTEAKFFAEYYSTNDMFKKEQMFMTIYDYYKNMFFKELWKSYTVWKSMEDYETNFKIEFLKALRDFQQDKWFRFSTYLFTKIKAAIQRTNKEESAFSVKEYKLNVLNIYKSKIVTEIQRMKNMPKAELEEILAFDNFEIKNFEWIDLKKIYNDMYAEYKLPKVKFETLVEDLPLVFTRQVSNTWEEGQDTMDVSAQDALEPVLTTIDTEHIDIYFKIKDVYKRFTGKPQSIRLELTKMGFNLECTASELKNLYLNVENWGEDIIYYLENNICHPEDKLEEIKARLNLTTVENPIQFEKKV